MKTVDALQNQTAAVGSNGRPWAARWWGVLLVGGLLWVAAVGAELLTGDIILLPSIVLLGSFLVPVTAVVWYLDHDASQALSARRIATAFIVAGLLGLLAAATLEFWLVYGAGVRGDLKVGFIEEFVKAVGIVALAWGLRTFITRDGMVLGAAVGFGFAALESSGYALAALFNVQGQQLVLSFQSVVLTELARGVLAPFGHGLWAAILGGAIFHAARHGRLRLTWGVLVAYVGVSILHGAFDIWNSIPGYIVISIIGIVPLVYLWVRGDRPWNRGADDRPIAAGAGDLDVAAEPGDSLAHRLKA